VTENPDIIVMASTLRDYADPQQYHRAAHRKASRVNSLRGRTRRRTAHQHLYLLPLQNSTSSQTRHRWIKDCPAAPLASPNGQPRTSHQIQNIVSAQNVAKEATHQQTTGSIGPVRMTVSLASPVNSVSHGVTSGPMTTAESSHHLNDAQGTTLIPTCPTAMIP
jgi:hypothetical protein